MSAASTPGSRHAERRGDAKQTSLGRELLLIVGVALILSVLVRTFLAQAFYVPSESMENTLLKQDRIVVSKLTTQFGGVHRGEWLPGCAAQRAHVGRAAAVGHR